MAALAAGTAVAAGLGWLYRSEIVTNFVDDSLAQLGVEASYDIEQIGLGRQQLRNVVIGNPADPDLVIDRLDLSVAIGASGPYVAAVAIDGARLRGRLVDGALTFGAVDKLIPADDGTPPEIPDVHLSLQRSAMTLDTPWGLIGAGVQGRGQMSDGFAGNIALRTGRLDQGDCRADRVEGNVRISVSDRVPRLVGPVGAAVLQCRAAGTRIADLRIGLDGQMSRTLDQFRLKTGLRTGAASLAGPDFRGGMASLRGEFSVDGHVAGDMAMQWNLRGLSPAGASLVARELTLSGRGARAQDATLTAQGDLMLAGLRLSDDGRRALSAMARSVTTGTAIDLLTTRLTAAIDRAGSGGSASLTYRVGAAPGQPATAAFGDVRFDAQSGAFVQLAGSNALTLRADGGGSLAIDARFGGGGLPSGRVNARSVGGRVFALSGEAVIAPYGDSNAAIALSPVVFSSDAADRTRFRTAVRLSGPIPGGRVENLGFSLDGALESSGAIALSGACQQLRWDRLMSGSAVFGAGAIPLCGEGRQPMVRYGPGGLDGGIVIGATRLRGTLGDAPLDLTLASGRLSFVNGVMAASGVGVSIGTDADATRLSIDQLTGAPSAAGYGGAMTGAVGQIGNLPFRFSDIGGAWQWRDSALTLTSSLIVADAAADARFQPLAAPDTNLRFADGQIIVRGTLVEPSTRMPVATVAIDHDLASVRGHADIIVDDVRFARGGLQPVMLTRLTLGVIADATGTVRGRGRVDWSDSTVTSSGRFSTDALEFAAAFGPVQGLSGTIHLSDLISMETPPGQEVRLASVNPGIEVTDGRVRYQLLPGQQVGLESGEWPLAGGRLLLRPAVLDFGVDSARHLTFDLDGLDAGLFLSRFEFDNINATGQFDGTIPTIFDANGGRIEGGVLTARAGGSLAYVGELTYQNLGAIGNLAFGALRSVRYNQLDIRLNGRIDGDMLTEVDFAGLAQGDGVDNNILTRAIRRLPVIFRIRINAPFRSLLTSARGLYDPTILIDQNLSALIRAQRESQEREAQRRAAEQGPPPPVGDTVQPVVSDRNE